MITIKNIAAQGDVLFRRIQQVPRAAAERPRDPSEPLVVAHSETGHHHVIEARDATWFATNDPRIGFLRFVGPFVDVRHQRPFHTHETLRLLGEENGSTVFEVRRQRDHIPEGWRDEEDEQTWMLCQD